MHQDECMKLYTKIQSQMSAQDWPRFIADLKKKADADDQSQILFVTFCKLF